jgi:CubicO group peptidase (beta-lactamase class C family)
VVLRAGITVQNLLEFTSGLVWNEDYENKANQYSSVLAMLYGVGHNDRASFVGLHGSVADPGTLYEYSTGSTTLLAAVVDQALRAAGHGETWPWDVLFNPIGMSSAIFERDPQGRVAGASLLYATPRDFAKFGALYLQNGFYNGTQLLPDDWVKQSLAISPAFAAAAVSNADGTQGWQWWSNKARDGIDSQLPWPNAPADTYRAEGHWGQSVNVIPSLCMVIVRTGDERDTTALDDDKMLALSVAVGRP